MVALISEEITFDPERIDDPATYFGVVIPGHLHSAVKKRRIEFAAGRYCAEKAMMHLLGKRLPVASLKGQRSPIWPSQVVGSITHTHKYARAVLGLSRDFESIGIDSELLIDRKSLMEITERILTPTEQRNFPAGSLESGALITTCLFSLKESVFKTLYPLCHKFFDFQDAEVISLDLENQSFSVNLKTKLNDRFQAGFQLNGTIWLKNPMIHSQVYLGTDAVMT